LPVALLFADDYVVLADAQEGPFPLLSDRLMAAMQSAQTMILRLDLLDERPASELCSPAKPSWTSKAAAKPSPPFDGVRLDQWVGYPYRAAAALIINRDQKEPGPRSVLVAPA
jgi:hypothetical protein